MTTPIAEIDVLGPRERLVLVGSGDRSGLDLGDLEPQQVELACPRALVAAERVAGGQEVEQGRIQFLDVPAATAEMEAYERSTTETGMSKYSAPEGMHDDTVIALALAVYIATHDSLGMQYWRGVSQARRPGYLQHLQRQLQRQEQQHWLSLRRVISPYISKLHNNRLQVPLRLPFMF